MHLTLRFLGEIDPLKAEKVGEGLVSAASTKEPFIVSTDSLSLKGDKLLWVGFKESAALTELKEAIDAELEKVGIKKESRGFRPHLTLMRVRNRDRFKRIKKRLKELNSSLEIEFQVKGVQLLESELGPNGAKHSVLREYALKNNKRENADP